MLLFLKTFLFAISISFLVACSGGSAGGPPPPPTGIGGGSSGVDSPLHAEVKINYIGSATQTSVGVCTIPRTAPTGTFLTCNMQIPELDAHFSDYEFLVSTNSRTTCKQVRFMPYSYKRSNSTTFLDMEGNEHDCLSPDPFCYGGAAKHLLPKNGVDFPQNIGIYFLTSQFLQQSYLMDAPDITRGSDPHISAFTNTPIANNLSTGARGAGITNTYVDYVGGSFNDYIFECRDSYGEVLYRLTLIIGDDDLSTTPNDPPMDTFWDWGNL